MKRTLIIFGSSLLVFLSLSCTHLGCKDEESLIYLKNNFRELYVNNYSLFSHIVHEAAKKAESCDTLSDTVNFLDLVQFCHNADFGEFFSDTIEHLCINNPKCFLDALINLGEESRITVLQELSNPVFVNEAEIEEVLMKYKNNPKYEDIINRFFSIRKYEE